MRGKWLGSWKMSKGIEKMLHRMIQPNADVRCTASEALGDSILGCSATCSQKTASSETPDKARPRNVTPLLSSRQVSKGQPPERKRVEKRDEDKENIPVTTPNSKKNPVRQRVLSGSGGKFRFSVELEIVNHIHPVLGLAKRRPDVNAHMLTPLRQKENVSARKREIPARPRKGKHPCPTETFSTEAAHIAEHNSQAFCFRRPHSSDAEHRKLTSGNPRQKRQ
jgi:hypothetical protein